MNDRWRLPNRADDSLMQITEDTMKNTGRISAYVATLQDDSRPLLAPVKHTMVLTGIILLLTIAGIYNGHGTKSSAPKGASDMVFAYLFLIGMEWAWVMFIYRGMQKKAASIWNFIGRNWLAPRNLVGDAVFGALALLVVYASSTGLHRIMDPFLASAGTNPVLPSTPHGLLDVTVWLALSISAGICEEIVFRGYLQRQLAALTGSTGIAILGQALIFGIGHAYEGIGAVVAIVLHGLLLGLLAQWRGNIRAGIVEHASWDILNGLAIL